MFCMALVYLYHITNPIANTSKETGIDVSE